MQYFCVQKISFSFSFCNHVFVTTQCVTAHCFCNQVVNRQVHKGSGLSRGMDGATELKNQMEQMMNDIEEEVKNRAEGSESRYDLEVAHAALWAAVLAICPITEV